MQPDGAEEPSIYSTELEPSTAHGFSRSADEHFVQSRFFPGFNLQRVTACLLLKLFRTEIRSNRTHEKYSI